MNQRKTIWLQRRNRVSEIIEATTFGSWLNRAYGILSTLLLLVNLSVTVMYTFVYLA